jgi:hypothetical protein
MAGRQPLDCRIGCRLFPDLQPRKSQGSQKLPHPSPCTALSSPFRARARTNVSNSPHFRQQITHLRLFHRLDSTAPAHLKIISTCLTLLFSRAQPPNASRTHATHPKYKGKSCILEHKPVSTQSLPRPPLPNAPIPAPIPAQHSCIPGCGPKAASNYAAHAHPQP